MTTIERPAGRGDVTRWLWDWPEWLTRMPRPWAEDDLKVEEFKEGAEYVVRAELPGIDPDKDVEIYVQDGALRIKAERREETKEEKKGFFRSEFRYGSLTRMLPLPAGCSEADVKATYKDGILEVRLPVSEARAGATKVSVTRQ